MTNREKAIKEIEILKEDYWDDDGYGHETNQHDDTMFALDTAIETLESVTALSADLKAIDRNSMSEEVLIGFNMAIALFNKHFGGDAE